VLTDPESAQRFRPASLAILEEPVRRYFTHAVCDGAPLAARIQLTMVGRIKLGPVWLTFTAQQEFDGHEFAWKARAGLGPFKLLHVVDQYSTGAGSIDGRIFGRFSFLHADDENTTRAAAARGAVESIWVPASLLPDEGVTWRVENRNLIVSSFDVPPERPEVRLLIDDVGAVRSVSVMRWGNVDQDDYGYIPFGGHVSADRRFGDFVLPSRVSVGWWFGTRRFAPFFQAEILDAVAVSPSRGVV
jgi:hypothetical protein